MSFRKQYALVDRKREGLRMRCKYPDRVPIIVEKSKGCKVTLDKHKYIVPGDLLFSQFLYVIRKRMKLSSTSTVFAFINNVIPNPNDTVMDVYNKHKDNDSFMYVTYCTEMAFG
jgi:GABA(A) receptor-associated protein